MKEKILFEEKVILNRIQELGKELTQCYDGEEIVAISLLRGSFMFTSDLVKRMDMPVIVEFLTTSSYESREESNGEVEICSDIREDIEGKRVLIIDDIMDSGHTMSYVINHLKAKKPKEIKTVVLLDKPSRREVDINPDFVGFEIEDCFIVGYGLNYGSLYRNKPYIFSFIED